MDLRQLEFFLEVARRSSFTQAARALGVAQPAISQSIARLEAELEIELFARNGRSVRLTEAGSRLVPHAERILGDVATARQEFAQLHGVAAGRLTVGATPTVATHLLPRVLAAYRRQYPHVEVILREGGASVLVMMLGRAAVDLAIVVLPVDDPALVTIPLFTEPLLLAVAEDSSIAEEAQGGPVSLRIAANEPFILYRISYHLRSATLNGCRAVGFEPRVALEGGEMETVLRMVAAGLGVSLVPQLAFEGAPRPGVVALPLSEPRLDRTLGIARRHDHPLSLAAEAFVAMLHAQVDKE
jgi:LysR family transcriptional regulator, transcription activator of glutamate synthase operon